VGYGAESMAARESKKVIYAAIVANVAIAIGKFAAAGLTGSSAMLAEAFHSIADTGNEALLIGERTNRARIRRVKEIITADPSVEKVGDLLAMQLGPQQVLLTMNIQFQRNLGLQHLELTIDRIENRVCESEPMIQRIFIEAESFKRTAESPSKVA
jgi:divalent metal cation (Fe/Co/Zn/Cd) transporter